MYCMNCGNEISADSKFCNYCGNSIGRVVGGKKEEAHKKKTKSISDFALYIIAAAILLGIFALICNIHTCDWCHETYIGAQYYDWDDPDSLMCEECAKEYYSIFPYQNYKK